MNIVAALCPEYQFGDFRLLPERQLLLRGNEPVGLPARALALLTILAERGGVTVSNDELRRLVWRDLFVVNNNLSVQIWTLRQALGADLIETVSGQGYRLAADIVRRDRSLLPEPDVPAPRRSNLPLYLDGLIGRAADLQSLAERQAQHRLVTIVGPGGVGKTRLAVELGDRVEPEFPDGVWLIDLAPLTDPEQVASAAAIVLNVALNTKLPSEDAIAAAIGDRKMLLIFDNCEYLAAAAGRLIEALLAHAAEISVLATSQTDLGLRGEQVWHLDPLALPPEGAGEIAGFGAIDLFVARATAADRRFRLDDCNAAGILAICRDLDGIPLAIEMAAARRRHFGIDGLRSRLRQSLSGLSSGASGPATRYPSLAAMVDWSYGLLDAAEQRLFRRLAIFRGGFSGDAVVAVAALDGEAPAVIDDRLSRLIDKSIVTVGGGEAPRYRLLETLRLYAVERLEASGELNLLRARLTQYLTVFFNRFSPSQIANASEEWFTLFAPELENVRASLDWGLADPAGAAAAIHLVEAARHLWFNLGLNGESKSYFDRAAALLGPEIPPAIAARILNFAGSAWGMSDRRRALSLHRQAAALYRDIGDSGGVRNALGAAVIHGCALGRLAEAKLALVEIKALLVGEKEKNLLCRTMTDLGVALIAMKELEEARPHLNSALDIAYAINNKMMEIDIRINMTELDYLSGQVNHAAEEGKALIEISRRMQLRDHLGYILGNSMLYFIALGNYLQARTYGEEALAVLDRIGGYVLRNCLQRWALIGCIERRYGEAARLIGYIEANLRSIGEVLQSIDQDVQERIMNLLGPALTPAERHTLSEEGSGWSEAQAVSYTRAHLVPRPAVPPNVPAIAPVTRARR